MSGESFVDYLDASDDVFFIALGNVRVTIYSVAGKARPDGLQAPIVQ
jgi:hypothetical protein